MKKTAIALFLLTSLPCLAQSSDNTFYAKQFPGPTVGEKVAAAQTACSTNTAIPCIIVIDPSLAARAVGTMPAPCAQCSWMDYRNGVPNQSPIVYVGAGGYPTIAAAYAALPSTGGTILLRQDVTLSSPYMLMINNTSGNSQGVTLDGGNHTINCTNTSGVCFTETRGFNGSPVVKVTIENLNINYLGSSSSVTGLEILNEWGPLTVDNVEISNFSASGSWCLLINNTETITISNLALNHCQNGEHITGVSTNILHRMFNANYVNSNYTPGGNGPAVLIDDNSYGIVYDGGVIYGTTGPYAFVIDSTLAGPVQGVHLHHLWFENNGDTTSATANIKLNAAGGHPIYGFSVEDGFFYEDTNGALGSMIYYASSDSSAQTINPVIYDSMTTMPVFATGTAAYPSAVSNQGFANTQVTYSDFGGNLNGLTGLHLWPQTNGHHYNFWAGDVNRGNYNNLLISDLTPGATYPSPATYNPSNGYWSFPFTRAQGWSLATDANIWSCTSTYSYTDSDLVCSFNGETRYRFDASGNMYFGPGAGNLVIPSTETRSMAKMLANCGTMTTTAAASNALSCAWVTASSSCAVTPSNATAVAWTYFAPSAGSVTVYHASTAGATYSIACSAG